MTTYAWIATTSAEVVVFYFFYRYDRVRNKGERRFPDTVTRRYANEKDDDIWNASVVISCNCRV